MQRPTHETLVVYQKAIAVVAGLEDVVVLIPPWRRDLRDQLRRAAASIALNIAEGAHEFSPAEKARFYRFARRSAAECMAALDVVGVVTKPRLDVAVAKARLHEVIMMLSGLLNTLRERR